MVKKRKTLRRRARSVSSSSTPADASSVASMLPGGVDDGAGAADAGTGAVPNLPPDPGADGGNGDAGAAAGASDAGAASDQERGNRVLVLRMILGGVFVALPPHYGGGALSDDESQMLADAWELPLRPYWDTIMGPWAGALLTTTAILAPRVIAARVKLQAAGVTPGGAVG